MKRFLKLSQTSKTKFAIVSEYFRYKDGKKVDEKSTVLEKVTAKQLIARLVKATITNKTKASPFWDSKSFGKVLCLDDSNKNRCFIIANDEASKNLIQKVSDEIVAYSL